MRAHGGGGNDFHEGPSMSTWPKEELDQIAEADDMHVSPFRDDGVTYGTPSFTARPRRSKHEPPKR